METLLLPFSASPCIFGLYTATSRATPRKFVAVTPRPVANRYTPPNNMGELVQPASPSIHPKLEKLVVEVPSATPTPTLPEPSSSLLPLLAVALDDSAGGKSAPTVVDDAWDDSEETTRKLIKPSQEDLLLDGIAPEEDIAG